jgi:hypothetical protein
VLWARSGEVFHPQVPGTEGWEERKGGCSGARVFPARGLRGGSGGAGAGRREARVGTYLGRRDNAAFPNVTAPMTEPARRVSSGFGS